MKLDLGGPVPKVAWCNRKAFGPERRCCSACPLPPHGVVFIYVTHLAWHACSLQGQATFAGAAFMPGPGDGMHGSGDAGKGQSNSSLWGPHCTADMTAGGGGEHHCCITF